jgi:hypothetical protein
MSKRGFEVTLLTKSKHESRATFEDSGVIVTEIGRVRTSGSGRVMDMFGIVLNLLVAMKRVNADIYYQRTASVTTGFAAFACERMRKPLIFASSSMWNATDNLNGKFYERTPLSRLRLASPIYRYGLSKAEVIVTQTDEMAGLFRKRYPAHEVVHIPPLAFPLSCSDPKSSPPFVLSVSRLISYRRPNLFLQVRAGGLWPNGGRDYRDGGEDSQPDVSRFRFARGV